MQVTQWNETITWKKYPDNKPEISKVYLVQLKCSEGYGINIFKYTDKYGWVWNDNVQVIDVDMITAFAKLPTGEIGEEFGFETALMLMKTDMKKGDLNIVSSATNRIIGLSETIKGKVDEDTQIRQLGYVVTWNYTFMEYIDGEWRPCDKLTADEILGKWRLA
jgi:hypothetical protein